MTQPHHGMSRFDIFLKTCLEGHADNDAHVLSQNFGWLIRENPVTGNLSSKHIVDAFDALVDSMEITENAQGPADAGMTFFGQFIDHDITLDATSKIGTRIDPRNIRNVRTPNLDLDCVYGDGPEASPHLYSRDHHGFLVFGRDDNPLDLARTCSGVALIGDHRNDENILVSQVHGAFICLHNILMGMAEAGGGEASTIHACAMEGMRADLWSEHLIPAKLNDFESVRRFVRLHYQWLVLHEFLPAFLHQEDIDRYIWSDPFGPGMPVMPVEFAGAGFRFGHATVQPKYELREGGPEVELFDIQGFRPREVAGNIEMAKFFGPHAQEALPIGMAMAKSLFSLPFVDQPMKFRDVETTVPQAQKLALRNILRDRGALHLMSGQQVARHLRIAELPAPQILKDAHIDKTPLWVYCLQEGKDGKLTGVGAAVVASVFGQLLKLDPESVVHQPHFKPWSEFGGENCTMAGVMQWIEAHRDGIPYAEALRCG